MLRRDITKVAVSGAERKAKDQGTECSPDQGSESAKDVMGGDPGVQVESRCHSTLPESGPSL